MSIINYYSVINYSARVSEGDWYVCEHKKDTDAEWNGRHLIAVDFDGVLHSYKTPWSAIDVIPDEPVDGAINWLSTLINDDFDACIYSMRCHEVRGVLAIVEWLEKHGMSRDDVLKLTFYSEKPQASLFIDDRAYEFNGRFPSMQSIRKFRPWNRREGKGSTQSHYEALWQSEAKQAVLYREQVERLQRENQELRARLDHLSASVTDYVVRYPSLVVISRDNG